MREVMELEPLRWVGSYAEKGVGIGSATVESGAVEAKGDLRGTSAIPKLAFVFEGGSPSPSTIFPSPACILSKRFSLSFSLPSDSPVPGASAIGKVSQSRSWTVLG